MRYASELMAADKEISRIRSEIAHVDVAVISRLTPVQERAAASKAAIYVWLAAILEKVVRDSLQTTVREITALELPLKELRLSLFSLLCDPDFESVASRSRGGSWPTKIGLFQKTVGEAPAQLSEHILPWDGRTIRAEHLDTIWIVLGISTSSVPSPIHRFALKDLADGRNEVAHGTRDPVSFGRTKVTTDLLRLTSRVDEVITHLLTELDSYVDHRGFTR